MFAVALVAALVPVSVARASFVGALVELVFATVMSFAVLCLGRVQYLNVIAFDARPSLVMLNQIWSDPMYQPTQIPVLGNPRDVETGCDLVICWPEG